MENEVFRKVTVCETYSVSNYGRVRNDKRNTFLTPRKLKGYERVSLWYNNKANDHRIHRLVAQAFIQNPNNKPEVNHKNGIRNDNRVLNLEWVTGEENVDHKKTVLNQGDTFIGTSNGNSSLVEEDVIAIRASTLSRKELAKIYNISVTQIGRIITRKLWKHI